MAKCPNRTRRQRAHIGGGHVNCKGEIEIVVNVPVVLRCKRMPKTTDTFTDIVKRSVRRYGVKIQADTLRRLVDQGHFDIQCNECGWSLKTAVRKCSVKHR